MIMAAKEGHTGIANALLATKNKRPRIDVNAKDKVWRARRRGRGESCRSACSNPPPPRQLRHSLLRARASIKTVRKDGANVRGECRTFRHRQWASRGLGYSCRRSGRRVFQVVHEVQCALTALLRTFRAVRARVLRARGAITPLIAPFSHTCQNLSGCDALFYAELEGHKEIAVAIRRRRATGAVFT
jgi:hypothetical protein